MKSNARLLLIALVATSASLAGCAIHHDESNDQAVSDASVTANVKAALTQDPVTRASNISVNTIDGTVELSGFVNTRDQRHEAERVANNVEGVHSVKDELQVNDQADRSGEVVGSAVTDDAISHRVERALAENPRTEDAHINVSTADGVVQLAGFVNSHDQKDVAGDVAGSVQGVRHVDNDLRITPGD
jgi:hyperosmotically inducible protein